MSQKPEYELFILIRPTVDETERTETIAKVQAMVTIDDSPENKLTVTHWGNRQLAYMIDNHKEAYYVLFDGPMNGREIRAYERELMYNENVIRHMFIRKEAVAPAPAPVAAAEAEAEPEAVVETEGETA